MTIAELEVKIRSLTTQIVRDRINLRNARLTLDAADIAHRKASAAHDEIRRTLATSEEQREAAEKDLAALMAAQEKK